MTDKFQNKYRIPTNRLRGYDYGSNGFYFVTICTKNRIPYFGEITAATNSPSQIPTRLQNVVETGNCPSLQPTIIGQTAIKFWTEIPKHYPFVQLDEFVVMPNHIHGILFFNCPAKNNWEPNKFAGQSKNLGAVIRAFKSTTKKYANQNNIEFEWQSRYHDRIIRNEKELNAIRQYIIDNPMKWNNDLLNVPYTETGNCPSLQETVEQEVEKILKEIAKKP